MIPETEEASSEWKTKNHYFYEIVNNQERKMHFQFAICSVGIPAETRETMEEINRVFPSRTQKENWVWKCPFTTRRIRWDENTTKKDIINALEELYGEVKDFEKRLIEAIG